MPLGMVCLMTRNPRLPQGWPTNDFKQWPYAHFQKQLIDGSATAASGCKQVQPTFVNSGAELLQTYTDYVTTVQQKLEKAHCWARMHLKVSGQAMQRQYQDHTRNAEYQPGKLVWFPEQKLGKSQKLQSD
ncbi:hypothetical protein E2C01_019392 [Portunus trituberculatus]|uniref:Uncharacterized protein n=1 Tax=Portunus trituberculatus TaxID=210409 RepID=A0A5B7DZ80_PORTR|nr:hypothetical protein [Portunus trituberculatus]